MSSPYHKLLPSRYSTSPQALKTGKPLWNEISETTNQIKFFLIVTKKPKENSYQRNRVTTANFDHVLVYRTKLWKQFDKDWRPGREYAYNAVNRVVGWSQWESSCLPMLVGITTVKKWGLLWGFHADKELGCIRHGLRLQERLSLKKWTN